MRRSVFKSVMTTAMAVMLTAVVSLTALVTVAPKEKASAADKTGAIAVGIDVSKWQGAINWPQVKAAGVSFAIVRVGNGKSGLDPYFPVNMTGAAAAGIKTGVYYYTTAVTPEQAAAEAALVLAMIEPYQVSMPVVIDIESDLHKGMTPEQNALICNTFCAIIESAGYYPMVYANKYFFTQKIGPVYYDKWVAQYASSCQIPDASIWQATDKGTMAGIAGHVDIDYQFKDYSQLIINTGLLQRKGFWYYYENYKMQRNRFADYGGFRYFVDADGHMVANCFYPIGDGTFYFDASGHMLTGFQNIAENTYYFAEDGRMARGLTTVGEFKYLFAEDGSMVRGWFNDGLCTRYYYPTDGHMLTGFQTIGDNMYYFDGNGVMLVGFQKISGQTFLFSADGSMVKGWFNDGLHSQYFAEDGHMLTGFSPIGGKNYFFDQNGYAMAGIQNVGNGVNCYFDPVSFEMKTGFISDGVNTYYFEPATGAQVKGFVPVGDKFYDFDLKTGAAKTGFQVINGSTYYFDPASFAMLTGLVSDGTNTYYFDPATGAMMKGLVPVGSSFCYFDLKNGTMQVGLQVVNGLLCYFDPATGAMMFNTIVVAEDGNTYQIGPDGVAVPVMLPAM